MADCNLPGPMCTMRNPDWQNDEGTMCVGRSLPPGSVDFADFTESCWVTAPSSSYPELMVLGLEDFFLNLDPNNLLHKSAEYYTNIAHDLPSAVKILKEMGFTGKAVVKIYKNEKYIVLGGYAGLRKILTGTRYKPGNIKIVDMVIGKAGVAKSVLEGGAVTFVLVAAVDIFQHLMNDKETLADLGVVIATDLTKAAIVTIAGYAVGAALAATNTILANTGASTIAGRVAGVALAATDIAVLPLALGIVVGVAVGLGLDYLDRKYEITKKMQNSVNRWVEDLELSFEQGMRQIIDAIWNMSTLGIPSDGMPYPGR